MAGKHGGARPGAGRKPKPAPPNQNATAVSPRQDRRAALLEQQQARAIKRGKLETAARIEAKRLEFLREEM